MKILFLSDNFPPEVKALRHDRGLPIAPHNFPGNPVPEIGLPARRTAPTGETGRKTVATAGRIK